MSKPKVTINVYKRGEYDREAGPYPAVEHTHVQPNEDGPLELLTVDWNGSLELRVDGHGIHIPTGHIDQVIAALRRAKAREAQYDRVMRKRKEIAEKAARKQANDKAENRQR